MRSVFGSVFWPGPKPKGRDAKGSRNENPLKAIIHPSVDYKKTKKKIRKIKAKNIRRLKEIFKHYKCKIGISTVGFPFTVSSEQLMSTKEKKIV